MTSRFERLVEELRFMILEFSEVDEVIALARVSRSFAETVRSWFIHSKTWLGRIPASEGFVFCEGLEVSDRVAGYFHYNEGEWLVTRTLHTY